ncbi:MAG: VOC family protein [Thermoplasmata archaeon]|nr:VOC family protein [Thermoplasmata archaeon]
MKFLYTGIEVTDLERSIRFYHEGLGMEVAGRGLVAATGGETASLHSPGSEQTLELNWYPGSKYSPGSELDHLAFEVDDVEATASRLVDLGGRVIREVHHQPEYDLAYVADPDGIWIELVHPKPRHKSGAGDAPGFRSATNR